MNILLVSYYNPLGEGGFEKQTMGLFKCLQKQGHQLACLTVSVPEKVNEVEYQLDSCKVFTLGSWVIPYQEKKYSTRAKIAFWIQKNTAEFLYSQNIFLCTLIDKCLQEIILKFKIDVIHIHGLKTSYYLANHNISTPIILDLLDSFTLEKRRKVLYSLQNQPNTIVKNLIEYFKILKIEKSILYFFLKKSLIVTISEKDFFVLKKLCSQSNIHVISAGMSQSINFINSQQKIKEKMIIFHGFMSGIHNKNALKYLVYKIIPLVHQAHPDLKLAITGFGLSDEIFSLSNKFDWIKVFPSVENINKFIAKATLTCWPFRYGSGVKTKIIESMALGKAVVTTTIGVEAFTESQKKGILIADNAKGLANHVTYLLSNPEECNRLGAINCQVAMSEFTWENRAKKYTELYELAIQKMPKEFCLNK